MYHVEDEVARMINRKLSSVRLTDNRGRVVFEFQDGHVQTFGVEGDCCSHSWIEHLELPGDIAGAELMSVEESGGVEMESSSEYECLQVYNVRFRTNRGDIVLEFRNSSNGYYGGYLVPIAPGTA